MDEQLGRLLADHPETPLERLQSIAELFRRRVALRSNGQRFQRGEPLFLDKQRGRKEALVNRQVDIFRILVRPFIRISITTKYEFKVVPLDAETHRAVQGVDGGPRANCHAVLLIDDLILKPGGPIVEVETDVIVEQPFWIADREISVGMFQRFMEDPEWPREKKPATWRPDERYLSG